jgi:hypothetical protein
MELMVDSTVGGNNAKTGLLALIHAQVKDQI